MGSAVSQLLDKGKPQSFRELDFLQGWDREALKDVFWQYRAAGSPSVALAGFMGLLKFQHTVLAGPAFELFSPHAGHVDFLTVLAPMIVMSNMHYIPRASLLFSLFDFNGSGAVDRVEFFIGTWTLLKGLSCFLKALQAPSQQEVEEFASTLFDSLDPVGAGLLTHEEFLTFAYRGKMLTKLFAPFPVRDGRLYEEQVFARAAHVAAGAPDGKPPPSLRQLERKLRNKFRLTPDPVEEGVLRPRRPLNAARRKPWRQPSVTRAHAWIMVQYWQHLSRGRRCISVEELGVALADDLRVGQTVEESLFAMRQDTTWQPEGVDRVLPNLVLQITGAHVKSRMEALQVLGSPAISFRAFLCVVWPKLPVGELETCMGWCKAYQTHRLFQDLLKGNRDEDPELDAEDIQELLCVIDGNGDGQLGVEEMCGGGGVAHLNLAKSLLKRMDSDASSTLSKAEVKSLLFHVDLAFKDQFRAASAAANLLRKRQTYAEAPVYAEGRRTVLVAC